jgi:hypothetical protein
MLPILNDWLQQRWLPIVRDEHPNNVTLHQPAVSPSYPVPPKAWYTRWRSQWRWNVVRVYAGETFSDLEGGGNLAYYPIYQDLGTRGWRPHLLTVTTPYLALRIGPTPIRLALIDTGAPRFLWHEIRSTHETREEVLSGLAFHAKPSWRDVVTFV